MTTDEPLDCCEDISDLPRLQHGLQEVRKGELSMWLLLRYRRTDRQKTSSVATTDPFKPSAASGRKIGENKLLSARARAAPYAKPGGSRNVNPYGNKCIDCKVS